MSRGRVYVLTNESMPNLVKVGMTTRSVTQRMNELFQTGVPTPFELYAEYECPDCSEVESIVHDRLAECRVGEGREFFDCPPEKAAAEVMNAQRLQVEEWLDCFIPNQLIVDHDLHIDQSDIVMAGDKLGVDAADVASAFHLITPDEMKPALERFKGKVKARYEARAAGLPMPSLKDGDQ